MNPLELTKRAERLPASGMSELRQTAAQLRPSMPTQMQVERRLHLKSNPQAIRPALTLPEMAQIMSARGFHPTSVQFGSPTQAQ